MFLTLQLLAVITIGFLLIIVILLLVLVVDVVLLPPVCCVLVDYFCFIVLMGLPTPHSRSLELQLELQN